MKAHVVEAQIVGEDEDDVRSGCGLILRCAQMNRNDEHENCGERRLRESWLEGFNANSRLIASSFILKLKSSDGDKLAEILTLPG